MTIPNLTHPKFRPELNTKLTQIAQAIQLLSDAGILDVSGLTLPSGAANYVLASPDAVSGTVTLRALVASDIPSLDASKITTGQVAAARGGTGQDTSGSTGVPRVSGGTWSVGAGISHLAASSSADLRGVLSDESGTGSAYFQGGDLGTPSAGALTNATGLPISSGVSGLASGIAAFLATPSSANLAAAVTDETGTNKLVFSDSPTIKTPIIDTSETCPLVIGGTGTTSPLTLRSTSGVGAAGADIILQVGNNGATEAMRILNSGRVGVGTSPSTTVHILDASTAQLRIETTNGGASATLDLKKPSQRFVLGVGPIDGSNNLQIYDVTASAMRLFIDQSGNVGVGATSFGTSAAGVLGIANGIVPTTSPTGMAQVYVDPADNKLKARTAGGTVTTLAA